MDQSSERTYRFAIGVFSDSSGIVLPAMTLTTDDLLRLNAFPGKQWSHQQSYPYGLLNLSLARHSDGHTSVHFQLRTTANGQLGDLICSGFGTMDSRVLSNAVDKFIRTRQPIHNELIHLEEVKAVAGCDVPTTTAAGPSKALPKQWLTPEQRSAYIVEVSQRMGVNHDNAVAMLEANNWNLASVWETAKV